MCPLRLILIFLSATLAGFFVIRNLKSQQQQLLLPEDVLDSDETTTTTNNNNSSPNLTTQQSSAYSKVLLALESGFWTFVDMASGKYLWRHLRSASKRSL